MDHPLVCITNGQKEPFDTNITEWYARTYKFVKGVHSHCPAMLIMLDTQQRAALACVEGWPSTMPAACILRRINRRVYGTWFEDPATASMVFEAGCGPVILGG